jgi:hypothetical protein
LGTVATSASELCRFAGSTSGAGHVAVTTAVAKRDSVTRVDVAMNFDTPMFLWLRIRYPVEEISTWRAGELQHLAVNTRYLVDQSIIRQQWGEFQRATDRRASVCGRWLPIPACRR